MESRMIPTVDVGALKQGHWYQFVVRFILGGAVTVATGLVARHWGPLIGGLFLSFPAIFPASASLLEQHQTEKKLRAGIACRRRGRKAAALDAAGAVLGGCGLIAFGLAAWFGLCALAPGGALFLAAMAWLVVAVSLWWIRHTRG
jgi:Protein of unknown function (DUF3147)